MGHPSCFTKVQWDEYQKLVVPVKREKVFDFCFDCTVQYQNTMKKEGKCRHPEKDLTEILEYS